MATARRRQTPVNIGAAKKSTIANLPPPLSALFLIYFDNKAGYTIGWKRSLPGVEVDGVVEYKSLPSGLHSVKQDLIYFVHGNYAGLSAFINVPAAEESRNARMIAVGVMVPFFEEQLGRCWEHAEELKAMASDLIADTSMTKVLEDYWEKYKAADFSLGISMSHHSSLTSSGFNSLPSSPKQPRCHKRSRSVSDSGLLQFNGHTLSTNHPAKSMIRLLETFGPLIFPIYRAALLRKRILITAQAPVHETCNFVYSISILSSIPQIHQSFHQNFAEHNKSAQPLLPLFSIGVHDISFLEETFRKAKTIPKTSRSNPLQRNANPCLGWVACTTDSILAMKTALYDVLVKMPSSHSSDDAEKTWPKLESPPGVELRATQRDFRRYKALMNSLLAPDLRHKQLSVPTQTESSRSLLNSTSISTNTVLLDIPNMNYIVEPISWSAIAYSSLNWWAPVDEQRSVLRTELESDSSLLSGLPLSHNTSLTTSLMSCSTIISEDTMNRHDPLTGQETAIVLYFQRLTKQILSTLENATDTTELDEDQFDENNPLQFASDDSEYESLPPIYVRSIDVVKMGLDVWSDSDHRFIQSLAREYIGRRSLVEGLRLDMCGIRIC